MKDIDMVINICYGWVAGLSFGSFVYGYPIAGTVQLLLLFTYIKLMNVVFKERKPL